MPLCAAYIAARPEYDAKGQNKGADPAQSHVRSVQLLTRIVLVSVCAHIEHNRENHFKNSMGHTWNQLMADPGFS